MSKVCAGRARPAIRGLSTELLAGDGVTASVQSFIGWLTLDAGQDVVAKSALALAGKVDALTSSDQVASAPAMGATVKQLIATLDELRGLGQAMDPLDQIRARRDARLLVMAAGGGWQSVN